MDFGISPETKDLVDKMRRFVEEDCLPLEPELLQTNPDWVELPPEMVDKLREKLVELGLWALEVPKKFGGKEVDTITYVLVTIEQWKSFLSASHRSPFFRYGHQYFRIHYI